ncbi:hypothetical protein QAD02_004841 [Eretmocerus hayati]|uniref:Uncharacterized protein n=1 Tax=Eretmocerus hayati TaxID=131215 RepID=A0ACC2NTE4_9HYME|nr:hypothetical protein QAD02_004841 [Eretmocerus hayati]
MSLPVDAKSNVVDEYKRSKLYQAACEEYRPDYTELLEVLHENGTLVEPTVSDLLVVISRCVRHLGLDPFLNIVVEQGYRSQGTKRRRRGETERHRLNQLRDELQESLDVFGVRWVLHTREVAFGTRTQILEWAIRAAQLADRGQRPPDQPPPTPDHLRNLLEQGRLPPS